MSVNFSAISTFSPLAPSFDRNDDIISFLSSSTLLDSLTTPEKEKFLSPGEISGGMYMGIREKKKIAKHSSDFIAFFSKFLIENPSILLASLAVRDLQGHLVFSNIYQLFSFVCIPSRYPVSIGIDGCKTLWNDSDQVKKNLESMKILQGVCAKISHPNLLDYMLALHAGRVDFSLVTELDDHPMENLFRSLFPNKSFLENKQALILRAATNTDYNESFDCSREKVELHRFVTSHFNTTYKVVNSVEDVSKKVNSFAQDQIKLLIIEGHGNQECIHLSNEFTPTQRTVHYMTEKNVTSALFEKLASDAVIVLCSCSDGGRSKLADHVAKVTQRVVFGASTIMRGILGRFDKEGSLDFYPKRSGDIFEKIVLEDLPAS